MSLPSLCWCSSVFGILSAALIRPHAPNQGSLRSPLLRTSHLFPLEDSCDVSGGSGSGQPFMIPASANTRVHRDSGTFSVTFVTIRGGETKWIHMNMTCLFWFSKLLSHDEVEIKSIFNWMSIPQFCDRMLGLASTGGPGSHSCAAWAAVTQLISALFSLNIWNMMIHTTQTVSNLTSAIVCLLLSLTLAFSCSLFDIWCCDLNLVVRK